MCLLKPLINLRIYIFAPAMVAVSAMCESAWQSGTVTSHASDFLLPSVTPSGRYGLPSSYVRSTGSFTAGSRTLQLNANHSIFSWVWRCCLGTLLSRARPGQAMKSSCPSAKFYENWWRCGDQNEALYTWKTLNLYTFYEDATRSNIYALFIKSVDYA